MQLKRWGFLGAVLLFSLLLAYLLRFSVPALADLERSTLDWRFSWRGAESVSESPIVLVAIDNASFEMLPERWPWPRNYYAHAVENLTAAGAKAIGIDVIFDVPDPGDSTRDEQLARIVRGKPVVLARKLERSERLSTLWQLTDPIPVLREAADPNLGLVSISADPDGIYRRYPIAMPFYNRLLNSFALEMLRVYLGISPATQPVPLEDGFRFGERFIPQFGDGGMMINYAGPRGTFPVYSMSSLLDDGRLEMGPDTLNAFNNHLLPDSVFQDKLVLIGSTVAELHDNHPTPFMNFGGITREMSGVEILANAIRTLLDQNYLYRFSGFWQFVIVLLLAALVLLLATRLPVLPAMGISFLMALLWVALAFWLFPIRLWWWKCCCRFWRFPLPTWAPRCTGIWKPSGRSVRFWAPSSNMCRRGWWRNCWPIPKS
ncbi:MAG TPA: CHASE2 domain-containing protein [Calditrichia bacterium]|nr:CHASE2 domain-containing protein [Calditrichia bacterium]